MESKEVERLDSKQVFNEEVVLLGLIVFCRVPNFWIFLLLQLLRVMAFVAVRGMQYIDHKTTIHLLWSRSSNLFSRALCS